MPSTDENTSSVDGEARVLSAILGFDMPAACVAGVIQNLALLARHWATVRDPQASDEA